jgi:hypothetical protein
MRRRQTDRRHGFALDDAQAMRNLLSETSMLFRKCIGSRAFVAFQSRKHISFSLFGEAYDRKSMHFMVSHKSDFSLP